MQQDNELVARLVELISQLSHDREDTQALLSAYRRGELSNEQIVNALSAHYQLGVGGAVRALAEHNRDAAQQLGERLRNRLNHFLAELEADAPAPPARPQRSPGAEALKDRDDAVLQREYLMVRLVANTNEAVRSASIFAAVRELDPSLSDEVMTAHLARMVKAGVIGRERKGRYHALPQGTDHLRSLALEIDARGLQVPAPSARVAE